MSIFWNGDKQPSSVIGTVLIIATLVGGTVPLAFADETAGDVAQALGLSSAEVSSASLGTSNHNGVEIQTTPVGNFPTEGNSFVVLSSGCANDVLLPNDEADHTCVIDGLNTSQGHDLVQFTIEINVPEGASKVSFDWKFYSDEFPEFVDSEFNDAFLAEKGSSTFTLEGNEVTAPNNVAFDQNGDLITINTSGELAMSAGDASGTTYDGATPLLTTTTSVPGGSSTVKLIFSIFDMGDDLYDTTVLLDDVRFDTGDGDDGSTTKKATDLSCIVPETALSGSTVEVSANLKDATTLDPIASATIDWSVSPSGPSASSTTDSNGDAEASLDLTGLTPGEYTVLASFAGDDSYQLNSCETTLEVQSEGGGNNPPVANDDSATTDENTSVNIDVLSNDSDPDGDSFSIADITDPANGTLVNNGDGTVTYTPDSGFTGTDEFEYTISDGSSTATAKVTVTVSGDGPPENSPPTADAGPDQTVSEGATATLNGSASTDSDGTIVSYSWIQLSGPPVTLDDASAAQPAFTAPNVTGDEQLVFQLTVTDDDNATDTDEVQITTSEILPPPENSPPTPTNDTEQTEVNATVTVDVISNDIDPDGDALNVTAVTDPANGTALNNGDGTVTYTPDAGFEGVDEFEYTISDGNLTAIAEVTIIVEEDGGVPAAVKAKMRALQDGVPIDIDPGTHGVVGSPVDCVGGIPIDANADSAICYLISNNDTFASEYKTDPSVLSQDASPTTCPDGDQFEPNKECFSTTFGAENFANQGEYRFVIEFYNGETLVDLTRQEYRLHSFFVVPESAFGAIALVASSLAVFGLFIKFKKRF